jgi:hypothetical protein
VLPRLVEFLWEYDWVIICFLVPLGILGLLYLRSLRIIQALPF